MGTHHKAYEDLQFLHSADARVLRILAEYLEPLRRFRRHKIRDTIVFFGSSRILSPQDAAARLESDRRKVSRAGTPSAELKGRLREAEAQVKMSRYYDDAVELSRLLTQWAMKLEGPSERLVVCTGAGAGVMEAANKGAALAGGKTIGLNISMRDQQATNRYVSHDLDFEFHYFFMRKLWFAYLARALVFFPGGFGTMDELLELLTLRQTKKITKPLPMVLYGTEYWDEIVDFDALVRWGTISKRDLKLLKRTDSVEEAYKYLVRELKGK
jgi:uncharacterized protein (TIGR00730 family)